MPRTRRRPPRRFHRPLGEHLEPRRLLADWQNARLTRDVNDDLIVTPLDAVFVINELNRPTFTDAAKRFVPRPSATAPFLDVTGDDTATPLDALTIIEALNFDRSPPTVSVRLARDSAPRGATNADQLTFFSQLIGEVSDPLSGVARLEFRIGDGPFVSAPIARDGTFAFTPALGEGEHTILVRAVDARENMTLPVPFSFTLDTTPPQLALDETGPRTTRTNVNLTGRLADLEAGVESFLAQIDLNDVFDVPLADDGSFSFITSLPTDTTADGRHLIRFRATDHAGNLSDLAVVEWTLDTRAPTVTSTANGCWLNYMPYMPSQFVACS